MFMRTERLIHVKVEPAAKKESFIEKIPGVFHVAVREEARGNAANNRVRTLVAHHFGVPVAAVSIRTGHHSQSKMLRVVL